MTAEALSKALGGQKAGSAYRSLGWWRCRCPVHGSSGATLAVRDGERGLIVKCWAGCFPRDILAELRRRGLIDGDASAIDARPDPADTERRRNAEVRERQRGISFARDIIASAQSATATVIERYLRTRVPGIAGVPPVIRYLPMSDPYARHRSGGRRPVMVAAVEHVEHGIVGAHRTWLAIDGSAKASLDPVRISSGLIGGGAVRLAPAAETLMVGEGVETCLAAMTATAMPAWAALSTSGLKALLLPPIVRNVIILADNDRSGAGEGAAYAAADRWLSEGRRVRIALPPVVGTDWADVLTGRDEEINRAVG